MAKLSKRNRAIREKVEAGKLYSVSYTLLTVPTTVSVQLLLVARLIQTQ